MSFFKELKEDIAQSVTELTETFDEDQEKDVADVAVEDFAADVPMPDDGIEEPAMMFTKPADSMEISKPVMEEPEIPMPDSIDIPGVSDIPDISLSEDTAIPEAFPMEEPVPEPGIPASFDMPEMSAPVEEPVIPEPVMEEPVIPDPTPAPMEAEPEYAAATQPSVEMDMPVVEETVMETPVVNSDMEARAMSAESVEDVELSTDEVTVITKGTTINGGIKSDTSLVVKGTIEGDVECAGKLTITGRVAGNTNASEIYVNTPRLEGDLNSKGIVKIDVGTVVIGGISSTSVVVAGAVKGNIEVNGPVIIDSTAVVKGDIKAKSIQINSGAVIDGHCSLQFADVDLDTFFE
ncbi:MAG: polymer-forming cytoskeletal protein [Eubacterium sp.]|nr:polymer-forming cytoskeletal protein [Eubacterium sp.]